MSQVRIGILMMVISFGLQRPAWGGWPVIDMPAFAQHVLAGLQRVEDLTEQVRQTQMQIAEYENALRNSVAPAVYIFDDISDSFREFELATQELNDFLSRYKDPETYRQLTDIDYYRSSPCYSAAGCSHEERALLFELRVLAREEHSEANWAAFKTLQTNKRQIEASTEKLQRLQEEVKTADGMMIALQSANQLAAMHGGQLMALREQLIVLQVGVTTFFQARAQREAEQEAEQEFLKEQIGNSRFSSRAGEKGKGRGY